MNRQAFLSLEGSADRFQAELEKDIARNIEAFYMSVAYLVQQNYSVDKAIALVRDEFTSWIVQTKRHWIPAIENSSYEYVNTLSGRKSKTVRYIPEHLPYAQDAIQDPVLTEDVEEWILHTANEETITEIDNILHVWEKHTTVTPDELAMYLYEEGGIRPATRADMISKTTVIWAQNEGAMRSYRETGFTRFEWIVTEDDRTCSYCTEIDLNTFGVGEAIFSEGDTITPAGEKPMEVPFAIEHPPLHPYCRCTIVPVIESLQT